MYVTLPATVENIPKVCTRPRLDDRYVSMLFKASLNMCEIQSELIYRCCMIMISRQVSADEKFDRISLYSFQK